MPIDKDPDKKDSDSKFKVYKNFYILGTVGVQMVVSVIIGFATGLFLDRWLKTEPWFMILFLFLGVAAGFLNIYRTAVKNDLFNNSD